MNKVDLPRNKEELAELEKIARVRLNGFEIVKTAFDPDPRLGVGMIGVRSVYDWIRNKIQEDGKNVDAGNFPPPPEA